MRISLRLVLLLFCAAPASAQEKPAPLLPAEFAGWTKASGARTGVAAEIKSDLAGPMREAKLTDFETAAYTRDGRKLEVNAWRFEDATGAYSLFTLLKSPEMQSEKIGTQAASNDIEKRVLFYAANILAEVKLDRISAMTLAELRALADTLPKATGSAANLPLLPQYLPKQSYVKNSAKFVLGPEGLARVSAPLDGNLVDFARGAELVVGDYETSSGTAKMLLIAYPTPQIAGDRLRAIEAHEAGHQHTAESAFGYSLKRTGPLVAMMHGDVSAAEARSLLASVNYDANVMWNEATSIGPKDNVGSLLINIIYLIGIVLGFTLVAGIAFGGIRILMKRLYPDRVFDRPEDMEIIRLNLKG